MSHIERPITARAARKLRQTPPQLHPAQLVSNMWLQSALLVAACISPAAAIFSDEVNHIDFHHALLGAPSPDSTFFLRPSAASNASLLYTISDRSILGAVNPRDGAVIWRQNLTRFGAGAGSAGFMRGSDGSNAVVSAAGQSVSSWSAQDGKLIWNKQLPGLAADLEILELEDPASKSAAKDALVLSGGEGAAVLRLLDGDSGATKWEYKDDSGDLPFQVSSSPTEVFYISLQSALLKGYKIKVTALDPVTGRQTRQTVLSSENEITGPESVLHVGSNIASPLIVWSDKAQKALKVNIIGTKPVMTLNIESTSQSTRELQKTDPAALEIKKISVHAPQKLTSLPHFLVHYKTAKGSWAEVYHVDLKTSTAKKAYELEFAAGQAVFATSNVHANVYFTRISELNTGVWSSASSEAVSVSRADGWAYDEPIHAVAEVIPKGKSVAVRAAVLREHGVWELIRNGESAWVRHEELIDAVAADWVDHGDQQHLAHELEVESHESLLGAYIHRVKRHLCDLEGFPEWVKELPRRVVGSVLSDEVTNLDSFGVSKTVVVATKSGRLYALNTGKQGAVEWHVQASETAPWDVKGIVIRPGKAIIYASDGSSVTVNTTSGTVTGRFDGQNRKFQTFTVLESNDVLGIQEDGSPASTFDVPGFLVTTSSDGRILGWTAQDNKTPAWEFVPPAGEKVIQAIGRPVHDPVASIGKVLGDRSVLYKYLNPNLALVTAVDEKKHTASFYLLDGVSGKVLYSTTQAGVDSAQPITSAISENWFAYSFFGDAVTESSAKGYQLVVSELYESPVRTTPPVPHVISQAFIINEPISHMAVTQTRQGITTRQLICTLPSTQSIVAIPRPVLDPRRPVDRDPTSAEAEEGLFRYSPFLEFDGKWFLTHARDVAGIQTVLSEPTLLESTSLIFAFGGDIFGTRATPSQAFDILGKNFSKLQLVLTVVALAFGVGFLAPMVRKKQVNALWKA
ncbi:hypothetical protein N7470_006092 [Penicillium chermesinum]|nr:hypothetical protein N7470_006092 [Penicillium chermesinum]